MGTIPIDSVTTMDSQGRHWTFDAWTTTDAWVRPEYGIASVSITEKGQSEPTYILHVCLADWSERWYRRFCQAFLDHSDFRETFRISSEPPNPKHPTVKVQLRNGPADIDVELASAIVALNQAGAITRFCCQGGLGETGYITLATGCVFPSELIQAWSGAKFDMFCGTIYASAPVGLENEASRQWLQSLHDWLTSTLDLTGRRYHVTSRRPFSLPRLPEDAATTVVRQDIQQLVRKGRRAKFRDFAALKSGRDEYSHLRYNELIARLSATDTTPIIASNLSESDQAAACRWVLRGLPVEMALRKVRVDREIRHNARHNT